MLQALRKVSQDQLILLLCTAVFLSYLPEAGEYSSIFVYLKLVSVHTLSVALVLSPLTVFTPLFTCLSLLSPSLSPPLCLVYLGLCVYVCLCVLSVCMSVSVSCQCMCLSLCLACVCVCVSLSVSCLCVCLCLCLVYNISTVSVSLSVSCLCVYACLCVLSL